MVFQRYRRYRRHGRTSRSHRPPSGGLLVLVLALVTLSLTLSPLAGEIGAAQGLIQACEEGFTLDEATGECVEAPPDTPIECDEGSVLDETTGECVERPPDPPLECDEGSELDEASGECVPTDEPLECDEGSELDEATGECVPTDEPLVECDEGSKLDEATGECVEEPGDALIPAADEPRQLAINKFFCPAGYEVTNRDPGQLISDCGEPAVSVTFTVSDGGGGYSSTQQTASGDASGAIFTDVPSGNSINVTETIPGGYGAPIVFCHGENTAGTIVQPAEDMIVENGRVYVDNREVFLTLCTWFNISTLEPPVETGTGTVKITKHACPEGYDASARDLDDMLAQCDDDAGVVNFNVFEYGGGGYDGGVKPTSGTSGSNTVTFENVPNVKLTIYEAPFAGYTDAAVFCMAEDQTIPKPYAYVPPEGGYNTVPIEALGEGGIVACQWFNLPPFEPGDGNTVTVYKWICPEGTVYNQDFAWYETNCTEYSNDVPFTLTSTDGSTTLPTGNTGQYQWADVPKGPIGIQESIPDGYGAPVVYCGFSTNETDNPPVLLAPAAFDRYDAPTGSIDYEIPAPSGHNFYCQWFNIPGDGNTVTVYKWICPEGTVYDQNLEWYETNCTQYADDVPFSLTSASGTSSTTPNTGQYQWDDVPMGPVGIQETIPYEYGAPVVFCGASKTANEIPLTQSGFQPERYDAPTGYVAHDIPEPAGYNFSCQWFNIPGGPGEITIYKWTCPEGYDLYAYGANPMRDCQDPTNDVTFFLDHPDPADTDQQTDTGDAIDGAVMFGGLKPGSYVVTEEVPADTASVFVWDCFGTRDGKVHPRPLSVGDTLNVDVFGGDRIVCHWYNVPEYDNGKVTVVKYLCATKTFKSEVDCQIYEDGAEFDLTSGSAVVDTKTTDGFGKIIWIDIEPGDYWLDEKDGEWCAIGSSKLAADKKSFAVERGEETIVKVYNCSSTTTTPTPGGKTGKQPTKYPNTGAGPVTDGGRSGPAELPAVAPLLGLGLLFSRVRSLSVGAAGKTRKAARAIRLPHLVALGAALPLIALLTFGPVMAQTGTPGAADADASGTPEARLCLPPDAGTPDASEDESAGAPTESAELAIADEADDDGDEAEAEEANADACVRGAVPARIAIEAANVDAEVEILETVAGVMEQPTGAEDVAWYKETARLGEPGNIVMAGHLNYWGVPEGVFFSLGALRAGDTIELTGDDDETLSYRVEWVRQEDATQPPSDDVLASTGAESLTLITCGGEWDPSVSEYNERTVARAVRIAEDSADAGT